MMQDRRARLLQAYQIAQLAGFRSKMPKWRDVERAWGLGEPKRRQTAAEIKAVMGLWAAEMAVRKTAPARRKPPPPAPAPD